MSTLAIDIKNLPSLDEIEDLMAERRREMAELRKLKSLVKLREKSKPREGPAENQPQGEATHAT